MRVLKIPSTEKQPFVAQAQGTRSAAPTPRSRTPMGNSIPISQASGAMLATAMPTLAGSGAAIVAAKSWGESAWKRSPTATMAATIPNAARSSSPSRIRPVKALPTPLASRKAKSPTESP